MMQIKIFEFNAFQVNTVVLFDDSSDECVIVDAACYHEHEQTELREFIGSKALKPVRLLNTHCHIDHILGCNFISDLYQLDMELHKGAEPFLAGAVEHGLTFGFTLDPIHAPVKFITEGDEIKFGENTLKVLHTPGHADGSVCFVHEQSNLVIVGDVLFRDSIGRTDLPTGNFDLLKKSIHEKLFTLPDHYKVIPGHGPETSIGHEKKYNPFVGLG